MASGFWVAGANVEQNRIDAVLIGSWRRMFRWMCLMTQRYPGCSVGSNREWPWLAGFDEERFQGVSLSHLET